MRLSFSVIGNVGKKRRSPPIVQQKGCIRNTVDYISILFHLQLTRVTWRCPPRGWNYRLSISSLGSQLERVKLLYTCTVIWRSKPIVLYCCGIFNYITVVRCALAGLFRCSLDRAWELIMCLVVRVEAVRREQNDGHTNMQYAVMMLTGVMFSMCGR